MIDETKLFFFRKGSRAAVLLVLCMLLASSSLYADEGMWVMGQLNRPMRKTMRELGLQMSVDKLYHPKKASLKEAVVSFGGFCSGVVVSEDGLVFTNHHCGFESIQQHSSVKHDYLQDGFVARSQAEELPNPELYVRFLLRTEDVTKRVLKATRRSKTELERATALDSVMRHIAQEVGTRDTTLVGVVDAYYGGNEFRLSVYRDYNDVRLVFAPPSSVGKFGWDTDNWMWPRHTGDFSVFRIYADKQNRPANYSPENVPYRPAYVAPISLDGYSEGSFCMTLGYPGTTERYLSSFGIEEMMNGSNQAMIDIRGVKQAIWKREMNARDDIRIKYASKYDQSSNYWKNSIGTNKAIRQLNVLEKKRSMEEELRQWIRNTPSESQELMHLLSSLELNYKNRREVNRALAYFGESFMDAPELVQLSLEILNFDFDADSETVTSRLKKIVQTYDNLDLSIDKEVFAAMLRAYRDKVPPSHLPPMYHTIDSLYHNDERAYIDTLYSRSQLTTAKGLTRFLERDTTFQLLDDPAILLALDLVVAYYEMNLSMTEATQEIERNERLYNAAIRRMYAGRNFYPDANSTMRLSFGTIDNYSPSDGVEYGYYTTAKGIFEKMNTYRGNSDFAVQPELLALLSSRNFGRYADEKGEMKVCFISNNDITGGNSGSAMFNGKGELLGLAFDGNWEAMSSDIVFEPSLQRCIGVDVRYMLFIIEKYGKATRLIEELKIHASR